MRSGSKISPKSIDYQPIIIKRALIMPALFNKFPREKTAMCVLAAQNSDIFQQKEREFCCFCQYSLDKFCPRLP